MPARAREPVVSISPASDENWRVNAAYENQGYIKGFTPEQLNLLKAMTQGPNMAPGDRIRLINQAADNLYGSMRFTNLTGNTLEDLKAVAQTYMGNPANQAPFADTTENVDSIAKQVLAATQGTQTSSGAGADGNTYSLWDFVKQKFTLRTISFLLVAVLLLWIGLKGISTPAIKIARGSVQ